MIEHQPFHRLVQIMPSGCWEWTGTRSKSGYGKVKLKALRQSPFSAHRIAYERAYGPIPDGMLVCHACDNPPCCNPAHLWVGTAKQNMQDAVSKGRTAGQAKTHCKHGHEFTPENTYLRRTRGSRACRACALAYSTAQYSKIRNNRGAGRANNAPASNS